EPPTRPGHPPPHFPLSTLLMRRLSPDPSRLGGGLVVAPGAGAAGDNHGTPIPPENIVDWGGGQEAGRDNYYITEDSAPAKLGSSLGWLLQLDGDNLRNALLNSP